MTNSFLPSPGIITTFIQRRWQQVLTLLSLIMIISGSAIAQQTLYAISGSGTGSGGGTGASSGAPSILYKISPTTGALLSTVGATGYSHISGISIHPTTGVMYGWVNAAGFTSFLVTINLSTGAATPVGGSTNAFHGSDLTFSPSGTLYVWAEPQTDDLYTVNTTTGAATIVGNCGCGTSETGLAYTPGGQLYMKGRNFSTSVTSINLVNPANGQIISSATYTGTLHSMLTSNVSNVLYTGTRGTGGLGFTLKTINPSTGAITPIGTDAALNYISALAFTPCTPSSIIGCPGPIAANTDAGSCNAVVAYNVSAAGSPTPTVTYSFSGATTTSGTGTGSGSTFNKGVTNVTITAANGCSTPATCSFTVTVKDMEFPVLVGMPVSQTIPNDPGVCGAVYSYTEPTYTDNCPTCGPATISGFTSIGVFGGHTYFRSNAVGTYSTMNAAAIAAGGHLATVTSPGEDNFLSANVTGRGWIALTDAASEGTFVWSNGETGTYRNWCTNEPNSAGDEDNTVLNWNSSSTGCWNDWNGSNQAFGIIEFDCKPVQTGGPANGSVLPIGPTTFTYQATDGSGNTTTGNFTITVQDNELPVITCPANATISCDEDASVAARGSATATDNCSAQVTKSESSTQVTDPNDCGHYNYTITRVWSAEDPSHNTTTCTQTITVHDVTAPTATCKSATVTLQNGSASITANDVNDNSSDNCSPLIMTVSQSTFSCDDAGKDVPVILTVKDVCGNTSTCSTTVHVNGIVPTCNITVTPSNNTNTGGVPTNIYIGYGPQSATINSNATGTVTYSWTPTAKLSCSNCANPVFSPGTTPGSYHYRLIVTSANGCMDTCYVIFCVKDVRVQGPGNNDKVFICHVPGGNLNNANTLSISTNAVASHLANHAGDQLGQCGQTCGNVYARGMTPVISTGDIKVYPNPNHGSFTIELPYLDGRAEILVTDVQGKVITRKTITEDDPMKVNMQLGAVVSGMYFVQVRNGEQIFRTKLVIE